MKKIFNYLVLIFVAMLFYSCNPNKLDYKSKYGAILWAPDFEKDAGGFTYARLKPSEYVAYKSEIKRISFEKRTWELYLKKYLNPKLSFIKKRKALGLLVDKEQLKILRDIQERKEFIISQGEIRIKRLQIAREADVSLRFSDGYNIFQTCLVLCFWGLVVFIGLLAYFGTRRS